MIPLKPARFYGRSLPRPRYFGVEGKDRVDPPLPVNDALHHWAAEAHWSMGGLSFKRKHLQGKIEGNLKKLRDARDDDDTPLSQKKLRQKSTLSPGKVSPRQVKSQGLKRKGKAIFVKGRHGRGVSETPVIRKSSAAIPPVMGEWGEEDGPSPHASREVFESPVSVSPAKSPIVPVVPDSVEIPISRSRPTMPTEEESDGVNLEEFSCPRDRPLRRSSRVTAIRRSFRNFVPSPS